MIHQLSRRRVLTAAAGLSTAALLPRSSYGADWRPTETVRIIVRKAFRGYDCEILEANNGVEGLAVEVGEIGLRAWVGHGICCSQKNLPFRGRTSDRNMRLQMLAPPITAML